MSGDRVEIRGADFHPGDQLLRRRVSQASTL
ncbi:hypothetical protein M2318_003496 [Metapseudomonas resinovorans]